MNKKYLIKTFAEVAAPSSDIDKAIEYVFKDKGFESALSQVGITKDSVLRKALEFINYSDKQLENVFNQQLELASSKFKQEQEGERLNTFDESSLLKAASGMDDYDSPENLRRMEEADRKKRKEDEEKRLLSEESTQESPVVETFSESIGEQSLQPEESYEEESYQEDPDNVIPMQPTRKRRRKGRGEIEMVHKTKEMAKDLPFRTIGAAVKHIPRLISATFQMLRKDIGYLRHVHKVVLVALFYLIVTTTMYQVANPDSSNEGLISLFVIIFNLYILIFGNKEYFDTLPSADREIEKIKRNLSLNIDDSGNRLSDIDKEKLQERLEILTEDKEEKERESREDLNRKLEEYGYRGQRAIFKDESPDADISSDPDSRSSLDPYDFPSYQTYSEDSESSDKRSIYLPDPDPDSDSDKRSIYLPDPEPDTVEVSFSDPEPDTVEILFDEASANQSSQEEASSQKQTSNKKKIKVGIEPSKIPMKFYKFVKPIERMKNKAICEKELTDDDKKILGFIYTYSLYITQNQELQGDLKSSFETLFNSINPKLRGQTFTGFLRRMQMLSSKSQKPCKQFIGAILGRIKTVFDKKREEESQERREQRSVQDDVESSFDSEEYDSDFPDT